MHKIALIPGDGIGVDVTREATKVLRCVSDQHNLALKFNEFDLGADKFLRTGVAITEDEWTELARYDAIFLGAMGDPRVPGNEHAREILLGLRFRLDLYINFRPCQLLHPDLCPLKTVGRSDGQTVGRPVIDFVIFRENTEGLYLARGSSKNVGTPQEE